MLTPINLFRKFTFDPPARLTHRRNYRTLTRQTRKRTITLLLLQMHSRPVVPGQLDFKKR